MVDDGREALLGFFFLSYLCMQLSEMEKKTKKSELVYRNIECMWCLYDLLRGDLRFKHMFHVVEHCSK